MFQTADSSYWNENECLTYKQPSLLFAVVRENIKIKSLSHVKVFPDEEALMRSLMWRSRSNNGDDGD